MAESGTTASALPWPPPPATWVWSVPDTLVFARESSPTVGQVLDRVFEALKTAGLENWKVFEMPDGLGFQVFAPCERIQADGRYLGDRFASNDQFRPPGTGRSMLRWLLRQSKPYFRIIAIMVRSEAIPGSTAPTTLQRLLEWRQAGQTDLPNPSRAKPAVQTFRCQALLYEFEEPTRKRPEPVPLAAPTGNALDHFAHAGLWAQLPR